MHKLRQKQQELLKLENEPVEQLPLSVCKKIANDLNHGHKPPVGWPKCCENPIPDEIELKVEEPVDASQTDEKVDQEESVERPESSGIEGQESKPAEHNPTKKKRPRSNASRAKKKDS